MVTSHGSTNRSLAPFCASFTASPSPSSTSHVYLHQQMDINKRHFNNDVLKTHLRVHVHSQQQNTLSTAHRTRPKNTNQPIPGSALVLKLHEPNLWRAPAPRQLFNKLCSALRSGGQHALAGSCTLLTRCNLLFSGCRGGWLTRALRSLCRCLIFHV